MLKAVDAQNHTLSLKLNAIDAQIDNSHLTRIIFKNLSLNAMRRRFMISDQKTQQMYNAETYRLNQQIRYIIISNLNC